MEDNAFTLMPMNQDISLDPGTTYEGHITISNPADATSDFSYEVSINPFSVSGEGYDVDLLTQYNRSLITEWITIDAPTGTLKPNESKQVNYTIKTPANAPSGGQYAALTVSAADPLQDTDGVSVSNVIEMASIIYAKVAGETIHDSQVLENNVPGFSTITPVFVSTLITNNGNVHEAADISLTVTDVFTGQVILPSGEATGHFTEYIMPETTYRSAHAINNLPAVGIVKVNQTVRIGSEVSTTEQNIVICPVWFMALVFLTLCAFVAAIVTIIKKHRRKSHAAV